jgi:D-alanyl-D-alanine carboxypeptidase
MGKSLDELASYMRPLVDELLDKATNAGLYPIIEDTGRSEEEQEIKLAQGVSWTHRSKHLPQPPENKSEAIDIVPKACISLKYWGWNGTIENSAPQWGLLIKIGENLGLRSGVHFPHPDPGHFEYAHK